jgi:hypothetical protein
MIVKRGILDAIYWRLHTSYLLNEREEAKKLMLMLEHEEAAGGKLLDEIGPVHYGRFLKIREGITSNSWFRIYGSGETTPRSFETYESTIEKKENDIHKALLSKEGKVLLEALLGISDEATYVHEQDLMDYGRCDILARDKRTVYILEVKQGETPFSVVSQIDKYRLAVELDLSLGLYDYVQAAVIAESFSKYVTAELSRLDVNMFAFSYPLSLRRVKDV